MKRDNHITIKLSDEELIQIESKSSEIGVTRSEYMRMCSMKTKQQNLKSVHIEL